ncbi:MAG: hypothetical protein CL920_18015 [Deltaproteobacteria bacterium]|nr:hypothetical protein [Deltaproteobacteria bacterium]|tara:strand:- start:16361 stop:17209 length:849 start_codon:yes stop_codon:yes gene_type:complete
MKKILLAMGISVLAIGLMPAMSSAAPKFRYFKGDGTCPRGWRLASYGMVKRFTAQACRAPGMGRWHIVRLAGGGSQDGWGYKCRNRPRDGRKLGGSLCVPAPRRGLQRLAKKLKQRKMKQRIKKSRRGPKFRAFKGDRRCPRGWRLASYGMVKRFPRRACRAPGMGQWHIVRLAGGGSQDGWGYKCRNRPRDSRKLGGSLCVPGRPRIPKFRAFKGARCPRGWRRATYGMVKRFPRRACRAPGMGRWHIARLAGGGSQDGWGYKCRNRPRDKRGLGHSLCVR